MPKEEDSELEEIIEKEELEDVADEVRENSKEEFDDNVLLKFLSESDSVSPSLERAAVAQEEVRLERVAEESPKKEEDSTRKKDYTLKDKYELNEEYSESKREYDNDLQEIRFEEIGSRSNSIGLQEIKDENSREKYVSPRNLERAESGDEQKYHSRKFK